MIENISRNINEETKKLLESLCKLSTKGKTGKDFECLN